MMLLKQKKGMALLIVFTIVMALGIIGMFFVINTINSGNLSQSKKNQMIAQYLAEAALEKTVYKIAKEVNDFPVDNLKELKDITKHRWFWYLRLPGVMASGGLTAGFGANQGIGVTMNLQASNLVPEVEYNAKDLDMEDIIKDIAGNNGKIDIEVKASIDQAWGISSKKPDLVIPGISIPDIPIGNALTEWINNKKLPSFEMPRIQFSFKSMLRKLTVPIPVGPLTIDFPIGKIVANFLPASLTKIDFKKIMRDIGVPIKIDLGEMACMLVNDILPDKLITPDIKDTKGEVQIEKYGTLKFEVFVSYIPDIRKNISFKHKINAIKEFKVADLQPVAPLYSFFITNSSDRKINFNTGAHFTVNSFDWEKLGIKGVDPIKLADTINFPGFIRVNGSKEMPVKLNFIGEFKGWNFITQTEWPLIFIPDDDDDYDTFSFDTGFIPDIPLIKYGVTKPWGFWQWPAFGTKNDFYTMPWPDSEATTHLFGDLGLKFPFNLQIEGNVTKKFRYWKAAIIDIYIPPIPPIIPTEIHIPIPMWRTKWSDIKNKNEDDFIKHYTYRWTDITDSLPFSEIFKDPAEIKEKTKDPTAPENQPANLYAMDQYAKKATYFYNDNQEFLEDLKKRIKLSGDNTFILHGVNFINSSVELPEMVVKGKGMIVCAGDMIINGNIKQLGGMGGTNVDEVRYTKLSLIAPAGKIIVKGDYRIDAAIYAKRGIQTEGKTKIYGNLVVDDFNKSDIGENTTINYVASKTRMSMASLIPYAGKYDPLRYYVSISDQWLNYNAKDIGGEK